MPRHVVSHQLSVFSKTQITSKLGQMGCILHFIGFDANVDRLKELSPVAPCRSFRRGEVRSTRPNSKLTATSGVTLLVSDADFEELERQLSDARSFLQTHASALKKMREVLGVERAGLDFGIAKRDVIVQVDIFPVDLIALLAEINCDLVLTQFPVSKRSKNRRRYRDAFRAAV